MNERLKELMKQAGLDDDMFPLDDGWENPELIKFAELIVRECVEIANKQFTAATGLDDRDCWTAGEMKKRFGVEE